MKTDLLMLAGMALTLMAVPMISHAGEKDDWATRAPIASGEPMDDCDTHHSDIAIAAQPAAVPAAEKIEAILAAPDVGPAMAPAATPAAVVPAIVVPPVATQRVAVPAKLRSESMTQAAPRPLSPAALLTFALIASPGTSLPQTSGGRD